MYFFLFFFFIFDFFERALDYIDSNKKNWSEGGLGWDWVGGGWAVKLSCNKKNGRSRVIQAGI